MPLIRHRAPIRCLVAARGRMFENEGRDHPPGDNRVGWAKRAINSRLVYLQPGDGASICDDPNCRRLVESAIRWVADRWRPATARPCRRRRRTPRR